jgi:guanylate kinase
MNPRPSNVLLVLAGPAGSGKSTLCERLVSEQAGFSRIITATTRPPREGEQNGVHYHFLSPERFDALVTEGAFLEWAWVHKRHRYGTLASAVLEPLSQGAQLVMNIDVQGVNSLLEASKRLPLLARHLHTVYIDVPEEELRRRLAGRGTDSAEEIERRMRSAADEATHKHRFDHIIGSSDRETDFQALLAIWRRAIAQG